MAKRRSADDRLKITFQLGPPPAGPRIEMETSRRMRAVAMELNELLRNRLTWTAGTTDIHLSRKMCERLKSLGVIESQLESIARAQLCEVRIPFDNEERGWEARVMPWEFLLNEGTRLLRGSRSTMVVRHLARGGKPPRPLHTIRSVSVVTSAPGAVDDYYSFDRERRLPGRYLGESIVQHIDNPVWDSEARISDLKERLQEQKPQIVHVGGVDNWQGVELLGAAALGQKEGDAELDGMLLADKLGRATAVPAIRIAAAIGSAKPQLVNFNIYNSAARTAALTVAMGAGAAIGFQDRVDDTWAELFWNDFYRALRQAKKVKVPVAFMAAVKLLRRRRGTLRGTGLVLWTATPVHSAECDVVQEAASLVEELDPRKAWAATGTGDGAPQKPVYDFEIEPLTDLNYSLLHNQRPLFKRFRILPADPGTAARIHVDVELHIGSKAQSYRESRIIAGPDDLRDQIFIPLTWIKDGSFWESVRSSLLVRISTAEDVLYERCHEVSVRPADEWVDTDDDRQWLSSFVYPRDPAVHRVISSAETFLTGIADDTAAGFDGYQSIVFLEDEDASDDGSSSDSGDQPDAEEAYEPAEDTSGVDWQVQAIWAALVNDIKLRYTNPPPTYQADSQRLRTPSHLLRERRGTCIDLTLLLASCLEYVEIYPVVFLLQGHAFPGYWRSDAAHDRFMRGATFGLDDDDVGDISDSDLQRLSVFPNYGWLLEGPEGYAAVMREIHDGNLVPIEGVFMTMFTGLEEAVEEGWENLRNEDEFHSMIDIRQARLLEVTPLPIRENSDDSDR